MIYTLRVECVRGAHIEGECVRVIEINENASPDDLHLAIQKAVDFDDDHLYEFFVGRSARDLRFTLLEPKRAAQIPGLSPEIARVMDLFMSRGPRDQTRAFQEADEWAGRIAGIADLKLKHLWPLPERMKLFYLFDWGDDWRFQIKKGRHAKPPQPKTKYPRVIEQHGPNPKQYGDIDEFF